MVDRKKVDIKLALTKDMEDSISDLQKEYIEEDLEKLDPIKENDINIGTTYIFENGDYYEASIMIRNGLSQNINFDKVPLCIVDENNKVLAIQIFSMRDLGDIPALSARPYKLRFNKSNMLVDKLPTNACKVVFNKDIKAISTVKVDYENLPDNMSHEYKTILNNYLDKLALLENGQISLSVYDVKYDEDEEKIYVTVVIRNGANKKVKIDEIPMSILDENNDKVLSTVFKTEGLEINQGKAGIYNFVFTANGFGEKNLDLNKLHIEFA